VTPTRHEFYAYASNASRLPLRQGKEMTLKGSNVYSKKSNKIITDAEGIACFITPDLMTCPIGAICL